MRRPPRCCGLLSLRRVLATASFALLVPAVALPVFPTFLTKVTAALAAIGKSMKTRTTGDTRNEVRMGPRHS